MRRSTLRLIVVFVLSMIIFVFTPRLEAYAEEQNANLAFNAAGYLQDNNGNPLPPSGDIHSASCALDGDTSTYAQAGGSYAWTLHVDLGSIKTEINKVVIDFIDGLYATDYNILLSSDGINWYTATSVTGCTGGSKTSVFTSTDARYVRVRAVKPDGPNQPGVQMAIAELKVYNVNLALKRTAYLQDNNGNPLLPNALIRFAEYAVDGDYSTYAQAGDSYAWTLHVDLGSVRTGINEVVVNFADGLYATDYNVLLSSDGINWTTAAFVSGCTGGSKASRFVPADARYVRVRAIKPDGPNQTGTQMAITELEVYNHNYSLARATAAYLLDKNWNSLSPLDTSSYARNAVDGNTNTSACAASDPSDGSYTWTLHDDLGSIKTGINKVVVTFDTSRYATDYFIMLSSDGTNWNRVACVTNSTGGTVTSTFEPRDARYVRIKALSPDGLTYDGKPNPSPEPGVRMAIKEMEVYAELDLTAPTVSMTKPSPTTGVRNDTSVELTFSEAMDSNTLNLANIQLKKTSDGSAVSATYSVGDDKKKFNIFPGSYLSFSTSYTVTVNNAVKDKAGNPVTGTTSWQFTTEASIPLSVETTSSTSYSTSPSTSIYPAFVDGTPYKAWTLAGSTDYFQLKGRAGTPPYTWSLVSGALPTGLILSSDGKISGTPTVEGNFNFRVRVTDSNNTTAEKDLVMEAKPYRAKWFTDAKFGFMIQWGLFTYPVHWTNNQSDIYTGISNWEASITNFNADSWAQEISNRGGKVLNFTVMGGDDIRLWSSTTPTVYGYKTGRDIVGELIAATHSRGIKFIAYLPAHGGWGKIADYSTGNFTFAELHYGIISELIDKGVDGFWIDIGGSVGEPTYIEWEKVAALIRTKNPDVTIESNSGTTGFGYVLQYPNTDIVPYEGQMKGSEETLQIVVPNTTKKKIAIDVDSMLEANWTWTEKSPELMKSAAAIINNIEQNWYRGAAVCLAITPKGDGTFIPLEEKDTLDTIAAWVNANKNWSDTPTASLSDSVEYPSPQIAILSAETGATIYYTTDGSIPTTNSTVYTGPITISKSTRLKAIAVKSGKGNSYTVMDKSYLIIPSMDNSISFINSNVSGGAGKAGDPNHETYVGMKIIVGDEPIVVDRIGKYYMSGNSKTHNLKIVRVKDNNTVLFTSIDMSAGTADSYGFKYKRVAPVTLEPGMAYYIMSLEDSDDIRWNGDLSSVQATLGARILGPVWSDYSGTRYYTSTSQMIGNYEGDNFPYMPGNTGETNGQLLNIKYTIGNNLSPTKNLVRGAVAYLQDNYGNVLPASGFKYTADLAIDGDMNTYAQAGNSYAWTLHVDLLNIKKGINKVVVSFHPTLYATDYNIMLSTDGTNWVTAASVTGFAGGTKVSTFSPTDARYVRIQAIKPDGPNQPGVQMAIKELEVYNDNLALGTTAALQDNNGNPLPPNALVRYASYTVDGDYSTYAQAGDSYAWTLHDDLGSIKTGINKVVVNFATGLYATDYNILLSTDGTNWTTVASVTGCTGGSRTSVFTPTNARYIRVRAIKPDGPNQPGAQMAITELEVYNDNLASGTTAALQDNNGNPLPPNALIRYASYAVDGDYLTYAQAGDSYAWTLHVDLGSIKTGISKVVVNFVNGLYATDYNILLSSDGMNWTTATSIINCTGGRSAVLFTPTDARYIRVRALKPDGPNQTGAQMAITELEVYKQ